MTSRRIPGIIVVVALTLMLCLAACGDFTPIPDNSPASGDAAATQVAKAVADTVNASGGASGGTTTPSSTPVSLPTSLPTVASVASPTSAPNITIDQPTATSVPSTAVPAKPTTAPAAPTATPVPPTATTAPVALDKSIRSTDWLALMKSDSHFKVEDSMGNPWVTVKDSGGSGFGPGDVAGTPVLDSIVYMDMDGDNVEEAAIPLDSGGTAGDIGFLIFHQATPRPHLVVAQGGYHVNIQNKDGKFVVTQPIYLGYEPNCCPSGFDTVTYTLKGSALLVVSDASTGIKGTEAGLVSYFYSLINDKKYDDAYKFLADSYQKANPFSTWRAGFKTTVSVSADTSMAQPGVVQVTINSTDTGSGGSQIKHTFTGTWHVDWSQSHKSWVLSNPAIKATS